MRIFTGKQLDMIAFPMGGIGAGMMCLQGRGSLGSISLRHRPDYRFNPNLFSAVSVKQNGEWVSRVVESPVADHNVFECAPEGGLGFSTALSYGLPRFTSGDFTARFPFAHLHLVDEHLPIEARITGWSPFIPGQEDDASLPFAALEYTFINTSDRDVEMIYYFASENFLKKDQHAHVRRQPNGFVLIQPPTDQALSDEATFSAQVDLPACVDACWVRSGWCYDTLTLVWRHISDGCLIDSEYQDDDPRFSPGATLAVPLHLAPGESRRVTLRLNWYVPHSGLHAGIPEAMLSTADLDYQPWYASRFSCIDDATADWAARYGELRRDTQTFSDALFDSDLPDELLEAVADTLSVLKSPTVLRQKDGRFWAWEGSENTRGSCHGSCTHVWNYQQALCHLFPRLERSLRETEFFVSQNKEGHQNFRSPLPIQVTDDHGFHAASDGQLGGIIKVYRDWRISGDDGWLKSLFPRVKDSLDYCIRTWDPDRKGVLDQAHHNTYDIEFWGADGMCTSFYLAALQAFSLMCDALGEDASAYRELYRSGRAYMEERLFNGEYFIQELNYRPEDLDYAGGFGMEGGLTPEVKELLAKEGPRYQYGKGCLSDGVLGFWLGEMSGLSHLIDEDMLKTSLKNIFDNNFRADLSTHANPQRAGYAVKHDGGLLLCTWPHGGRPMLPFVYCDEVWTGIEYQVAAHLILKGYVTEGRTILRAIRSRYDGRVRNPFDEYECGHWYARSMAAYGLLQAYTGVRYDAVEKALHVRSCRNSRSFLSTEHGFGTVTVQGEKADVHVLHGTIDVQQIIFE